MKAIIENGKINDGIQIGKTNKSAKIPYKIDCTSESFCQVWQ